MKKVSIAIETTCREGGLAMALDGKLETVVNFKAAMRHASQLVSRMRDILAEKNLKPSDITEVYVSAGPGSFTGVRLGMTVARTLGFLLKDIKFVSVPTTQVIAQSLADEDVENIAVVLDGKDREVYTACFTNENGLIKPAGPEGIVDIDEFLNSLAPNTTVIGEGISYCENVQRKDFNIIDSAQGYPKAENVLKVGLQLSQSNEFTELKDLLPVYARKPEAVRLWDKRIAEKASSDA